MINASAAGHSFINGVCTCGRRIVDFRDVTLADEGKTHITHIRDKAARYEIQQIIDLIAQLDKKIAHACNWN